MGKNQWRTVKKLGEDRAMINLIDLNIKEMCFFAGDGLHKDGALIV